VLGLRLLVQAGHRLLHRLSNPAWNRSGEVTKMQKNGAHHNNTDATWENICTIMSP
jgi:hypothetical protein